MTVEHTTSGRNGGAAEQPPSPRYIGLASRVFSFVIDAAIISVVAIMVEVGGR